MSEIQRLVMEEILGALLLELSGEEQTRSIETTKLVRRGFLEIGYNSKSAARTQIH